MQDHPFSTKRNDDIVISRQLKFTWYGIHTPKNELVIEGGYSFYNSYDRRVNVVFSTQDFFGEK